MDDFEKHHCVSLKTIYSIIIKVYKKFYFEISREFIYDMKKMVYNICFYDYFEELFS